MNEETLEMVEKISAGLSSYSSFSTLLSLAVYIVSALAIYTIAQRREIRHAWMAWVPLINVWTLGSVSDHYHQTVKGEKRFKRVAMLVVGIAQVVCAMGFFVKLIVFVVQGISGSFDYMSDKEMIRQLLSVLAFSLPVMLLAVVALVLDAIALYDVYASCDPKNKVLYLVLSLIPLVNQIARPLFLFLCRNKDDGMPSQEQPAPENPVEF